jgi:hypothetical protein
VIRADSMRSRRSVRSESRRWFQTSSRFPTKNPHFSAQFSPIEFRDHTTGQVEPLDPLNQPSPARSVASAADASRLK